MKIKMKSCEIKNTVLSLVGGVLLFSVAAASQAITLSIETESEVLVGSPVQIDVVASDVSSLGAYDLDLSFDSNLLGLQDVTFGDPLGASINGFTGSGGGVNFFELSLADPSVLDDIQGGSFVLASLSFDAFEVGSSSLDLSVNALGDALGNPLTADIEGATITISAPTIEKVAGDNQSVAPGVTLGPLDPFAVRVTASQGQLLEGVPVTWSISPAGAASLQSSTTTTGANGQTQNTLTALSQTGTITVTATVPRGNTVEFTLVSSFAADPGLDEGERAVAAAFESSCEAIRAKQAQGESLSAGEQDLLATCLALESGEAGSIVEVAPQLAPDEVATQGTLLVETSTTHLKNIGARLIELHNRASGFSVSGLTLNIDGQTLPGSVLSSLLPGSERGGAASADDPSPFSRLSVFVNGNVSLGDKDPTRREPGFDFDTKGVTLGADYRFKDNFFLGGAFGYTSIDSDLDSAGGSLDTDAYSLSLYGTYYSEQWYLDGIVSFGQYDYDYRRNIVFGTVNQSALAEPEATEYAVSIGGGYEFNRDGFTFGPYARFEYVQADIDSYREQPDDPSAPGAGLVLAIDSQDIESLTTTLGGQVFYAISTEYGIISPQLRIDWQHEFEDDARLIGARFVNDPAGNKFSIPTDDPDRNYFILGTGISAQFAAGKAGFIYYETTLGREDITQHSVAAGVRIEF